MKYRSSEDMKYRSYRIIDGKPRWVIIDGEGRVVDRNPSKEELKLYQVQNFKHNETNICSRCKKEKLVSEKALREYDTKGNLTGRWICFKCHMKEQNNKPYSYKNLIKQMAGRRIGNSDLDHTSVLGDMCEDLSCKLFGAKNFNKENDNYRTPIDHWCKELGFFQTKGRLYNHIERLWGFCSLERDWDKEFDKLVTYCISSDGRIIERIYIFPLKEAIKRKTISIVKNLTYKNCGWYEQYRVTDEEVLKKANDIWKDLM